MKLSNVVLAMFLSSWFLIGYGTGGSASVWGNDFDAFLTSIMQGTN